MKSDDQAHTFGTKNSRFSGPSRQNFGEDSESNLRKITLSEAIENFTLTVKVEGQAKKTRELYDYVFDRLLEYLSGERNVNNVEPKDIRKYLAFLMDDGLKDTSVAIHFRHLRAFFNWLEKENYLLNPPTANIREPKTPNKFPTILSKEDVQKLLKATKERNGKWSSYRNYSMLVVFLEMGLRFKEAMANRKTKKEGGYELQKGSLS